MRAVAVVRISVRTQGSRITVTAGSRRPAGGRLARPTGSSGSARTCGCRRRRSRDQRRCAGSRTVGTSSASAPASTQAHRRCAAAQPSPGVAYKAQPLGSTEARTAAANTAGPAATLASRAPDQRATPPATASATAVSAAHSKAERRRQIAWPYPQQRPRPGDGYGQRSDAAAHTVPPGERHGCGGELVLGRVVGQRHHAGGQQHRDDPQHGDRAGRVAHVGGLPGQQAGGHQPAGEHRRPPGGAGQRAGQHELAQHPAAQSRRCHGSCAQHAAIVPIHATAANASSSRRCGRWRSSAATPASSDRPNRYTACQACEPAPMVYVW